MAFRNRGAGSISRALRLLFQFQLRLIFFHELPDVVCGTQQAIPLFVIESDRKSSKSVYAYATLLSYFEDQVSAALLGLNVFFKLGQFGLQFLVTWFRHARLVGNMRSPYSTLRSFELRWITRISGDFNSRVGTCFVPG